MRFNCNVDMSTIALRAVEDEPVEEMILLVSRLSGHIINTSDFGEHGKARFAELAADDWAFENLAKLVEIMREKRDAMTKETADDNHAKARRASSGEDALNRLATYLNFHFGDRLGEVGSTRAVDQAIRIMEELRSAMTKGHEL